MNQLTKEVSREYRVDFNTGEMHWDDPIPPEVTSGLLGKPAICIIDRTSLFAWSLMMNVRDVAGADVAPGGWMKISVKTGPEFDEAAFARDVAKTMMDVSQTPRHVAKQFAASHLAGGVFGSSHSAHERECDTDVLERRLSQLPHPKTCVERTRL